MIDLGTLRKAKGYVLAIVDESTGEYKPVSSDVVQVIRCKDCHFYKSENLQCMMHEGDKEEWHDNDYCSLAERKEE